jgi:dihydroorotate dehydrogenase
MNVYTHVVRPLLFQLNPDYVHEGITFIGQQMGKYQASRSLLQKMYGYEHSLLETDVFGIHFKSPIGIAGGFDKDCRLIQTLPQIGFGFTEVGTITARPYKGNNKPWNIRLAHDGALLVNYGLKNKGVNVLSGVIKKQKRYVPLIINIGKTNNPLIKGEEAIEDYNNSFVTLQPLADIVNINISCPNTGDGQLFCENPVMLTKLLNRIAQNPITKPIILKLKPDISNDLLDEILHVVAQYAFIKGFIISNLTSQRSRLTQYSAYRVQGQAGGISGKPLKELSNQMIARVYRRTRGKYPIIGLGGVFTAEDAYEKICLGASLVELATGLIYGGPGIIKEIKKGLVTLLKRDGFTHISHAVGSNSRN